MGGPNDPRMQGAPPQRNLQTALSEAVNTFGEDGLMELLDRVRGMADPAQYEGMEPIDTTMMPPPDFGDRQPVTTLPATDEHLMNLEGYYGYPTHVVQPDTPGGRQVNNSYPGMELSREDQLRTQGQEAVYKARGPKRTVGKPRR